MGPISDLNLLVFFVRTKAGVCARRSPGQSLKKYHTLLTAVAARTVWAGK